MTKYANFTYNCSWCLLRFGTINTFTIALPDDLRNCMVRCPKCKTFLPKDSFISTGTMLVKKKK